MLSFAQDIVHYREKLWNNCKNMNDEVKTVVTKIVFDHVTNAIVMCNQRTNGPVNAHLRPEI